MPAWSQSINAHWELVAYGPKCEECFYLRERRTGRRHPCKELNRWYYHFNHDHLALSPDGRFAVFHEPSPGGMVVCTIDGSLRRWRWETQSLYAKFFFLPNGHQVAEVSFDGQEGKPPSEARIYDPRHPNRIRTVALPPGKENEPDDALRRRVLRAL